MEYYEEKPKEQYKGTNFWALVILPSILAVIAIIFSLFTGLTEYGFPVFVTPIVIIVINLIIIGFIAFSRLIREKVDGLLQEELARESYSEDSGYSDKFYVDWRKILSLVYSGKITNQNCQVCKLPLQENDFVLQCTSCQGLFHALHLIEWLGNTDTCPACFARIIIT